jgi:hypothetical protein
MGKTQGGNVQIPAAYFTFENNHNILPAMFGIITFFYDFLIFYPHLPLKSLVKRNQRFGFLNIGNPLDGAY